MKKSVFLVILAVVALVPACSKTSPSAPTVSFTAPVASAPANGATYKYTAQPVTLTITNAVQTGSATVTYSIEVATDSAFSNVVSSQDGIAQASGGTTSVTVGQLDGNTTYYWHWRTVIDGVAGPPSAPLNFFVQPKVVLNAPVITSPSNGGTASSVRPQFSTHNATYTGPAGTLYYEFQVSTSSSFSSITDQSDPIAEGSGGQTSWAPSADLPLQALYWRVRASDPASGAVSDYSSTSAFTIQLFDMRNAIILDNPPDLGSWAVTTHITSITFTPSAFLVDFDKRDGPGRWPDVGFGTGDIEYTLGMCVNPDAKGQWYCSAVVQFWYGRDLASTASPSDVGLEWFYDGRWAPILGYQPQPGEVVGIFVGAGNLRDSGNWAVEERSDVVLIPWQTDYVR